MGRSAPGAPPTPAGEPDFLWRKSGERTPGLRPGPGFLWLLVPTRWFLGRLPLIRSRGYYYRYPKTDLGRIFEGKYAGKHLCERKFPNQGTYLGPETAQRPFRCAPTLKAFPLGGRWAGKAGSDEGAILYPTFPCRKGALYRLSPQRNFSSAPLGKPVAPSSVTFGDSFPPPPRGSLWVVQPYTKKRPKSGHVHGPRNSPTTAPLRPTTPKQASESERALNQGGPGGKAPGALSSGFLRRKPGSRPESGGKPRRRAHPAPVQTKTACRHSRPPHPTGIGKENPP